MSPDPLADCDARMAWANADVEALASEFREFVKLNPYLVRIDIDGQEGAATFCRMVDPTTEAEFFDHIARLFGSHLDNVRAAMNYVAYQLAVLDSPSCPDLKPERAEFPIFVDPDVFADKRNWFHKLPGEHRDLLEEVQPYDGKRQGLWVLHELSRIHRHRLIHPARMAVYSTGVGLVTDQHTTLLDIEVVASGPLEDGQEIVRFIVVADNGDPKVQSRIPVTVGIDDPLCHAEGAIATLNMIRTDVEFAMETVVSAIWPERRLRPDDEGPPASA